ERSRERSPRRSRPLPRLPDGSLFLDVIPVGANCRGSILLVDAPAREEDGVDRLSGRRIDRLRSGGHTASESLLVVLIIAVVPGPVGAASAQEEEAVAERAAFGRAGVRRVRRECDDVDESLGRKGRRGRLLV